MKKCVIYVFSGTGNTLLVAGLYKKFFSVYDTTIYSLGSGQAIPEVDAFDLVGFAYPVHGFNAPQIMVNFCRSLAAPSQKKQAFIFKTSGEGLTFNNYSSQKMIGILERKGFEFLTERHYVMPYNMIFRHSPEMVKSEYWYAYAMVQANVKDLQKGCAENVHTNPLKAWFVPLVRIEWLYAKAQGPFMKVDMTKCVKCMKCVKTCPLQNISFVDGKFSFKTHCALCVRCSFNCPTCAISIGLLNKWRINGSYQIEKTAHDSSLPFPCFGKELKGIKKWLYYKYYRRCDQTLRNAGIELTCTPEE